MRMIDFVMTGTIVPLTPVNIARPDTPKDDPYAGIPMMTIAGRGGRRQVPHIPGEHYKGMLRAASADLSTKGRKLDLGLYHTVYKGGIKGSEKETVDDLRKTTAFRNSNPVLGLYGAAAPRWVQGCLSVGPAMPLSDDEWGKTESVGMRRDDFRMDPEKLDHLEEGEADKYIMYAHASKEISQRESENEALKKQLGQLRNPRDGKRVPDAQERIDAAQAKMKLNEEKVREIRESEYYKNTIARPLRKNGIAPGSILHQRICGTALTDVEFGLFLETLRQVRHRCRVGGLESVGYGFYRAEWRLSIMEDGEDDFAPAGSISLQPNEFALDSAHPAVKRSVEAWRAVGDTVTPLAEFLREMA